MSAQPDAPVQTGQDILPEEQQDVASDPEASYQADPFEILGIEPMAADVSQKDAAHLRESAIEARVKKLKEDAAPGIRELEEKIVEYGERSDELKGNIEGLESQIDRIQTASGLRGILARDDSRDRARADLPGTPDGEAAEVAGAAEAAEAQRPSLGMSSPSSYLEGALPPKYRFFYNETAFKDGSGQLPEHIKGKVPLLVKSAVEMIENLPNEAKADIEVLYRTVLKMCCDDAQEPEISERARPAVFGLQDLASQNPQSLGNYKIFFAHGLVKIYLEGRADEISGVMDGIASGEMAQHRPSNRGIIEGEISKLFGNFDNQRVVDPRAESLKDTLDETIENLRKDALEIAALKSSAQTELDNAESGLDEETLRSQAIELLGLETRLRFDDPKDFMRDLRRLVERTVPVDILTEKARERIAKGIHQDLGMQHIPDEFRDYLAGRFVMVGSRDEDDWVNAVKSGLFVAAVVSDVYFETGGTVDVYDLDRFFQEHVMGQITKDSEDYADFVGGNPVGSEGYKPKAVFLMERINGRSDRNLGSDHIAFLLTLIGVLSLDTDDLKKLGCSEEFMDGVSERANSVAGVIEDRLDLSWTIGVGSLQRFKRV